MAGDSQSNLIESVHSDVNREGLHCTLVGGLIKGDRYDHMQASTLAVRSIECTHDRECVLLYCCRFGNPLVSGRPMGLVIFPRMQSKTYDAEVKPLVPPS